MATEIVVPATNPARVPKPPRLIKDNRLAVEFWNDYWKLGISTLWTKAEHPTVARLCHMQAMQDFKRENEDGFGRLNVQVAKTEQALFLSPQSRQIYHITVETEAPAEISSRRGDLAERMKKSA